MSSRLTKMLSRVRSEFYDYDLQISIESTQDRLPFDNVKNLMRICYALIVPSSFWFSSLRSLPNATMTDETGPPPPQRSKRSFVCNHFTVSPDDPNRAVCRHCEGSKDIACGGGSTSALGRHLRSNHGIIPGSDSTQAHDQPLKLNTLDGIIARLAAEDHIPFSTTALSSVIRPLVSKFTGESLPLSANTCMRKTINEAALARAETHRYLESY